MNSHHALLAAWLLFGVNCGWAQVDDKAPPMPRREPPYLIKFSAADGSALSAGNANNLAFAFDFSQRSRVLTMRADAQSQVLVAGFDHAGCVEGQQSLLQAPLAALAPGEAAWVDYVDISLLPLPQKDVPWSGGVCFGLRRPSGQWTWHLHATALAFDAASERVRARLWIKDGPATALKIVFEQRLPRHRVDSVTMVATPVTQAR